MKLLIEQQDFNNFTVLNEAEGKDLYITGPFIQMDVVNRNNRIYPSEYIKERVEKYIREQVETSRAIGELNHPATPEINYERAAILITSLQLNGNDYIGKAKVLEKLPLGSIVGGLVREGVKVGVSSRAMGTTKERSDGIKVVQRDYRIQTAADIVSDPSAPDAFVTAIMESKEWVFKNGVLVEEDIKDSINKAASSGLTSEKMKQIFEQCIERFTNIK